MIRVLFLLTDFLATFLSIFLAIGAVIIPFSYSTILPLSDVSPSLMILFLLVNSLMSGAIGFFLLSRRLSLGFIFILLSFGLSVFAIPSIEKLYMYIIILFVFGLPWVLGLMAYKKSKL